LIGPEWSASVFHHDIKVVDRSVRGIYVESAGHGIQFTPTGERIYLTLLPGGYDLVEITDRLAEVWRKNFEPAFAERRVNMPWKWGKGLMWNDPEGLRARYRP